MSFCTRTMTRQGIPAWFDYVLKNFQGKKMTAPGGGRNGLRSGDKLWIIPWLFKRRCGAFCGYLFCFCSVLIVLFLLLVLLYLGKILILLSLRRSSKSASYPSLLYVYCAIQPFAEYLFFLALTVSAAPHQLTTQCCTRYLLLRSPISEP